MSAVEPTGAATTLPVATTHLYILRTTVAAIAAQEIAGLVGLPAPYWATMTALVVMQSTLAASWSVSWKRLLGTALGAIVGGALAMLVPPCTLTFAVALVATGLLCAFTGLDRVSYRLAGVTLAVVMLAAGSRPASIIAIHRFAEVSIGIVVTLVITAVWPERAGPPLISSQPRARLTRHSIAGGQLLFNLSCHSPSLLPGSTPHVRDDAQPDQFLEMLGACVVCVRERAWAAASPRRLRSKRYSRQTKA